MSRRRDLSMITLAIGLGLGVHASGADPRSGSIPEPVRLAVERQNAFTRSLVQTVGASARGDNLVVAPLGVAEVLDLLRQAAAGETAAELSRLLGPSGSRAPLRTVDPSRPTVRPRLAAELANNDGYGVKVMGVPEDSPEARAGLRAGDLILAFQGQPVRSRIRLLDAVARSEPGGPATLQIYSYDPGLVLERRLALGTETTAMSGLSAVRGLWIQTGTRLAESFRASVNEARGLALFEADFRGQPKAARAAIDAWLAAGPAGGAVAIDPAIIEADTRLLLIDRLILRASWARPFPRAEPGEFRTLDGARVSALLMRQEAILPYVERKAFRMLELPFDDGRRSFVVVLADAPGAAVPEAGEVADALKALRPTSVDVILPRFTLETTRRLETGLAALGVKRAFSDDAEFPGLGAREPLKLGAVVQSVKLDVRETGVKVEALTGAGAVTIRGERAEPRAFHANRPFVFLVVDRQTGLILLAGRKVR